MTLTTLMLAAALVITVLYIFKLRGDRSQLEQDVSDAIERIWDLRALKDDLGGQLERYSQRNRDQIDTIQDQREHIHALESELSGLKAHL